MVGLKQDYKPTIGLNSNFIYYRQAKQLSRKNMNYLVWDLGGKQSFRKVWENYYPFCHGLVYLFDHRVD
jgi:GTPase SAR1 family protein